MLGSNAKGKPKPTEIYSVGCCVRPYLPIHTLLRGSRQVERGINSRGFIDIFQVICFVCLFEYSLSKVKSPDNFRRRDLYISEYCNKLVFYRQSKQICGNVKNSGNRGKPARDARFSCHFAELF